MHQLIHQRVGRFNGRQFLHFRVNHQSLEILRTDFLRKLRQFYIAEAMESEVFPDAAFHTVGNVDKF